MFGIGVPELLIIFIVGLIVFGPGKLPEIGKELGKGIRELKKVTSSISLDTPPPPKQANVATAATSTAAISTSSEKAGDTANTGGTDNAASSDNAAGEKTVTLDKAS